MKALLPILLLGLGSCTAPAESWQAVTSAPPLAQQKKELVQVTGSAVSFDILTYTSVTCAGYDKQFSAASPILITDKGKLLRISSRLAGLQQDPNGYGIDVRAKVILAYHDQSHDTLCLGNFTSYYRGTTVVADTVLNQLLGIKRYSQ
jgi:hypothetical protein